MTPSVLLAGIFHETHTFIEHRTGMDAFEVCRGEDLVARHSGFGSPLSGVLEYASEHEWCVIPSVFMCAMPSGLVAHEVVELFVSELLSDLERHAADLDGIYLVLHGAMVSTSWDDVEGEVLGAIAESCRSLGVDPHIGGVLDLHANTSAAMASSNAVFCGYRCNPHTDAREAAVRGAAILDRLMRDGLRPRTVYRSEPLLFSPQGTDTARPPLRPVLDRAAAIETSDPDVLCINVFGGFAYADIADAGFSVTCSTLGDEQTASQYLAELGAIAAEHKEAGHPQERPIDDVLKEISSSDPGPIALVEPSDNIGGGMPGDGTHALRALIDGGLAGLVAVINDPESVRQCHEGGVGAELGLRIGGKTDRHHGDPIAMAATVCHLSDGVFQLEDPHSHLASMLGHTVCMGDCATIRAGSATVLLTSRKTPPFDLAQLRSQGIEPESAAIILVKAAVAHRQAYDPIVSREIVAETPGLGSGNLCQLAFKKVRRPIFPLD